MGSWSVPYAWSRAPVAGGGGVEGEGGQREGQQNGNEGKTRSIRRGESIFLGRTSIVGRIREHQSSLPPEVVRCANCHGVESRAASAQGAPPRIDRSLLLEIRSRRGGPPSAYDSGRFCKMLRTGVDPASILIAREMPIYEIDDGRCVDLWRFLVREERRE